MNPVILTLLESLVENKMLSILHIAYFYTTVYMKNVVFRLRNKCFHRATNITTRFPNYDVTFEGIGYGSKGTEIFGACSQMAVFKHKPNTIENIDEEENYKNFFRNNTEDEHQCLFCDYQRLNDFQFISQGVCTYESKYVFDKFNPNFNYYFSIIECEHKLLSYYNLMMMEYPQNRDERTREEKILHNAMYTMTRLGGENGRYYDSLTDAATIPIRLMTIMDDGTEISEQEVR